jgi:hypothetical protein
MIDLQLGSADVGWSIRLRRHTAVFGTRLAVPQAGKSLESNTPAAPWDANRPQK